MLKWIILGWALVAAFGIIGSLVTIARGQDYVIRDYLGREIGRIEETQRSKNSRWMQEETERMERQNQQTIDRMEREEQQRRLRHDRWIYGR